MKKIVLTGGPGAGKTAVLELVRKEYEGQVAFIPEAASLIFAGGFWRHQTLPGLKAAQRAIYYVQRELERMVQEENVFNKVLCDRGTIDGAAYWPGTAADFWRELQTDPQREMQRYDAVIHLRTPGIKQGYNHQNPQRIESSEQAQEIDARIFDLWRSHPCFHPIASTDHFLDKAQSAVSVIRKLFTS
jgi:predicted ATPase